MPAAKKNTELSKIIKKFKCGYYINYGEEHKLKSILKTEYENLDTSSKIEKKPPIKFSKKEQAKKYVQIFNKLTTNS